MLKHIFISTTLILSTLSLKTIAQETIAVKNFYSQHLIHGHTTESLEKGVMDFRINHRFGEIKSGAYDLFGADQATTSLSLEYGFTDNFMLGLRRSSLNKTFELYGKHKLLKQTEGAKEFPFSLSILFNGSYSNKKWDYPERDNKVSSRYTYTSQLLISHKFTDFLTLQLMPSLVHRNLVKYKDDSNNLLALGIGGNFKINHRLALTMEYYLVNHSDQLSGSVEYRNPISIGLDIKTGAHVFQLFLSNSTQVAEKGFIGETTGDPLNGEIFFGFNISKAFSLKK
ncbi:MAG: hypothetical protein JKX79_08140 [Labilibaculum sp.]|nr:hypothetical protein [Labilibaculum sp.]